MSDQAAELGVSGFLPEPDLSSVLIAAGFKPSDAKWIESRVRAGPYSRYTVKLQPRKAKTRLAIDTFLLEPWIHRKTGERGQCPYGYCEEFLLDEIDGWKFDGCSWYD